MGSGGTPLQEPPVHPFTAAEDIRDAQMSFLRIIYTLSKSSQSDY